ncbi:ClpP/crotonase-like domain-containing protein [Talaromyces proteolyticus]|uniref:ClpP/crotonase-like domain-containing protein n=1 Tax=Talaromyces proteolyticus TaxID=1131652 RepID=A0AAD4KV86_9EURO|nr:ClpP/crotonase-like domain-containing protein [Talaromyces proteolyticus]KAH8699069.1 ClpP/crotonase-like domain-containing protein [Talaromyces proteolyticus]
MIPSPEPVVIPTSYEAVPTTDIKVFHHPRGSKEATSVIVVTLNRPQNQNAFTISMMDDFEKLFPIFDVDERVKVIVLTGAGKTFCAGADLDIGFHGDGGRSVDYRDPGGRLALAIYRCRKPTIAAMQGSAVGLGMTMTLPAAIRIGYERAKYGFVFARRGVTMESSSSFFLPRLIGYSCAMYLLTTGGVFPPNSKHFGTLFAEIFPEPSQVLQRALELATEIAENVSPLASYLNRSLMWRNPGSAEGAHLVDSAVLSHMFSAKDQKEGVSAFFERRKPNFTATIEEDGPPNFPWWQEVDTGSRAKAGSAKI